VKLNRIERVLYTYQSIIEIEQLSSSYEWYSWL